MADPTLHVLALLFPLLLQVRHTWQLDPAGFELANPKFQAVVDSGAWRAFLPVSPCCLLRCRHPASAVRLLGTAEWACLQQHATLSCLPACLPAIRHQAACCCLRPAAAVARCCERLGVESPVEAQLHKLLLYEQGSHFSVHRDSEKADNMWGEPQSQPALPWQHCRGGP